MDYELMMNGNVKIGQKAPDFKAITTFRRNSIRRLQRKMAYIIFTSRRLYPRMHNRNDSFYKSTYIF